MAPTRKNDPAKKGRTAAKANAGYNTRVNASGAVVKPCASVPAPVDESAAIEKPILDNASEFNLLEQPLSIIFVGKGDNTREISIHKNLLIQQSAFFRAALEECRFFEGHTQTVHLPEVDPGYFTYIARWIYQQKVGPEIEGDLIKVFLDKKVLEKPAMNEWLKSGRAKDEAMVGSYYDTIDEVKEQLTERALTYIEVWKLADFLSMPKLANYIMRRLVQEYDSKNFNPRTVSTSFPLSALATPTKVQFANGS